MLVPNSAVLAVSISPLREPEAVGLAVRLRSGIAPIELQRRIEQALTVAIRRHPAVTLRGARRLRDGRRDQRNAAGRRRRRRVGGELLDVLRNEIGHADTRDPGDDGRPQLRET